MDLEIICKEVCGLAREVGGFIRSKRDRLTEEDIETKGIHNYVTFVDKEAERRITKVLQELVPEAGFVVEEETITKEGERFNWIVDPLDCTSNFILSFPVFSISIALSVVVEPFLGVIYVVLQVECFYAWKGGKAFMNDRPIRVSGKSLLDESLIATGFPYTEFPKIDEYLFLLKELLEKSHGIRRLGSAAIDLAYVASGRLEGFYEYGLNPWDVSAGVIIVKEAGGTISDFGGGTNYIGGCEIIASNKGIYNELYNIIRKYFG
jgi:myo-inositol-1(or 4)-monophosphatase